MAFRKTIRKLAHRAWVSWQETSVVMLGLPVQLDPAETGDKFARSPVITEVHETRTVKAKGRLL